MPDRQPYKTVDGIDFDRIVPAPAGTGGDYVEDQLLALVDLGEQLDTRVAAAEGAAPAIHTHAAGDITSGTLDPARLPDLSTEYLALQDAGTAAYQPIEAFASATHQHVAETLRPSQVNAPGTTPYASGTLSLRGGEGFGSTAFGGAGGDVDLRPGDAPSGVQKGRVLLRGPGGGTVAAVSDGTLSIPAGSRIDASDFDNSSVFRVGAEHSSDGAAQMLVGGQKALQYGSNQLNLANYDLVGFASRVTPGTSVGTATETMRLMPSDGTATFSGLLTVSNNDFIKARFVRTNSTSQTGFEVVNSDGATSFGGGGGRFFASDGTNHLLGATSSYLSVRASSRIGWTSSGTSAAQSPDVYLERTSSGRLSSPNKVILNGLSTTNGQYDYALLVREHGLVPNQSGGNTGQTISIQGSSGVYFHGRDSSQGVEFLMGTSTQGAALVGAISNHPLHIRAGGSGNNRLIVNPASQIECLDDFEITASGKGVVLRSPDGTRYRLTVDNGGTLATAAI